MNCLHRRSRFYSIPFGWTLLETRTTCITFEARNQLWECVLLVYCFCQTNSKPSSTVVWIHWYRPFVPHRHRLHRNTTKALLAFYVIATIITSPPLISYFQSCMRCDAVRCYGIGILHSIPVRSAHPKTSEPYWWCTCWPINFPSFIFQLLNATSTQ